MEESLKLRPTLLPNDTDAMRYCWTAAPIRAPADAGRLQRCTPPTHHPGLLLPARRRNSPALVRCRNILHIKP